MELEDTYDESPFDTFKALLGLFLIVCVIGGAGYAAGYYAGSGHRLIEQKETSK